MGHQQKIKKNKDTILEEFGKHSWTPSESDSLINYECPWFLEEACLQREHQQEEVIGDYRPFSKQ